MHEMKATALLLNWKRPDNIRLICQRLAGQDIPVTTYLWNNNGLGKTCYPGPDTGGEAPVPQTPTGPVPNPHIDLVPRPVTEHERMTGDRIALPQHFLDPRRETVDLATHAGVATRESEGRVYLVGRFRKR